MEVSFRTCENSEINRTDVVGWSAELICTVSVLEHVYRKQTSIPRSILTYIHPC